MRPFDRLLLGGEAVAGCPADSYVVGVREEQVAGSVRMGWRGVLACFASIAVALRNNKKTDYTFGAGLCWIRSRHDGHHLD